MLTLINTLSLATALTLQPTTENIKINVSGSETTYNITIKSNLQKEEEYAYAVDLIFLNETKNYSITFSDYTNDVYRTNQEAKNTRKKLAIGYLTQLEKNYDISKYKSLNETEVIQNNLTIFNKSILNFTGNGTYNIDINIRSTTFMEELLTALTTAVQSAVSIFVEGFGGLTQIFYNGTEITFIGGILIVGLAVMFLMMFLRWIVSFVKGI